MTGHCTVCGRSFNVRDGIVVFHRRRWASDGGTPRLLWPQPPCPGWGKPPKDSA